jgi:hypothetical protein
MDTVKFAWLKKGRTLTIAGPGLPGGQVIFADPDNARWYKWTFDKAGRYKCVPPNP